MIVDIGGSRPLGRDWVEQAEDQELGRIWVGFLTVYLQALIVLSKEDLHGS